VRGTIQKFCSRLPDSVLHCETWSKDYAQGMGLKFRSTFCFEPHGDNIGRKSLSDDYASGCIPVFFGTAGTYQYPAIWQGWHTAAYIVLDRLAVVDHGLDIIETLRKIPQSKVQEIQANIALHGGMFQHNMQDSDEVTDGIAVMLRRLWVDALNLTGGNATR